MGETGLPTEGLQSFDACKTVRLPVAGSEVDGLVEVEAVVEASMVGLWKSNDELPRALIKRIYPNTSLLQLIWGQECDELE